MSIIHGFTNSIRHQPFFVTRVRTSFTCRRLYSNPVDKSTGLRSDQIVVFTTFTAKKDFPDKLRRIVFLDLETGKRFTFLTNNFVQPALTIAMLYKSRWQVELFFKWIKQHLRIKSFYGTSFNAVKTQIWIAISVYLLVAILKKRLDLEHSLYTILQILSVILIERIPILWAFQEINYNIEKGDSDNQLLLFD